MASDRRPGGRRPDGDRPRSFDARRPGGGRPPRRDFAERPFVDRPPRERSFDDRPARPRGAGGFPPRGADEGGMSIRLDPRRLAVLRALASEAGVRPGELVTRWLEERLDASRAGGPGPAEAGGEPMRGALAQLAARVDELAARLDAMAGGSAPASAPVARRRGRPPRNPEAAPAAPRRRAARGAATKPRARAARRLTGRGRGRRIALHDEIAAVIGERGPLTAAELAVAIRERGNYAPPRSAKPLDAAGVNSRVSNRLYRGRFARSGGKIGLADA